MSGQAPPSPTKEAPKLGCLLIPTPAVD